MSPSFQTLLDVYERDAERLRRDIEQAETELRHQINASGRHPSPTGIEFVDWLADQFVFFRAAQAQASARGLQGLAALEWTEYLSWPECRGQAGSPWRQALLRRHAFEEPSGCWQRVIQTRFEGDPVAVGPPRNGGDWYPPVLQFGPYPASDWYQKAHETGRWTKKLQVGVLEAVITFDPWTKPDALFPVRRLEGPLTWRLELTVARKYGGCSFDRARVVIDEPRSYQKGQVLERLRQVGEHNAGRLRQQGERLPPHVLEAWKGTVRNWQRALSDFESATTTGQRSNGLLPN